MGKSAEVMRRALEALEGHWVGVAADILREGLKEQADAAARIDELRTHWRKQIEAAKQANAAQAARIDEAAAEGKCWACGHLLEPQPVAWKHRDRREILDTDPREWGRADEPWTPLYATTV